MIRKNDLRESQDCVTVCELNIGYSRNPINHPTQICQEAARFPLLPMITVISSCNELDCPLDSLNVFFHLRLTCSQFPLPRFQVMQLRPQSRHISQNSSLFGHTLVLIHNLRTPSALRRVGDSFDIRRRRPVPSFDVCIQIPLPRKPSPVSSAC